MILGTEEAGWANLSAISGRSWSWWLDLFPSNFRIDLSREGERGDTAVDMNENPAFTLVLIHWLGPPQPLQFLRSLPSSWSHPPRPFSGTDYWSCVPLCDFFEVFSRVGLSVFGQIGHGFFHVWHFHYFAFLFREVVTCYCYLGLFLCFTQLGLVQISRNCDGFFVFEICILLCICFEVVIVYQMSLVQVPMWFYYEELVCGSHSVV